MESGLPQLRQARMCGADLLYWRRKREQWRQLAEGAPDEATAEYLTAISSAPPAPSTDWNKHWPGSARSTNAGSAPITRASGRSISITHRHIKNNRLANVWMWAFTAASNFEPARQHYRKRRDAGDRHAAATRHLFNKLLASSTAAYNTDRPSTRTRHSRLRSSPPRRSGRQVARRFARVTRASETTEPSLRRLELTAQLGHNPEYAFANARRRCGGDFQ